MLPKPPCQMTRAEIRREIIRMSCWRIAPCTMCGLRRWAKPGKTGSSQARPTAPVCCWKVRTPKPGRR